MNRKSFIEAQGATCRNWTWSWSFVNDKERVVIFGAWDINTDSNTSLILNEEWSVSRKGRKQSAYKQSREHIRLIEEKGYELKTFPIIYSAQNEGDEGDGPAKIESFIPELTKKHLKKVANSWYASDDQDSNRITEELDGNERFTEGAAKTVSVNIYERNADARRKCIQHHGFTCAVCSFDFQSFYGDIGKNYIHVHHVIPLSEIKREYVLDAVKDLIPVCPNCHAIIHKTKPALSVEQLKQHLHERQQP